MMIGVDLCRLGSITTEVSHCIGHQCQSWRWFFCWFIRTVTDQSTGLSKCANEQIVGVWCLLLDTVVAHWLCSSSAAHFGKVVSSPTFSTLCSKCRTDLFSSLPIATSVTVWLLDLFTQCWLWVYSGNDRKSVGLIIGKGLHFRCSSFISPANVNYLL